MTTLIAAAWKKPRIKCLVYRRVPLMLLCLQTESAEGDPAADLCPHTWTVIMLFEDKQVTHTHLAYKDLGLITLHRWRLWNAVTVEAAFEKCFVLVWGLFHRSQTVTQQLKLTDTWESHIRRIKLDSPASFSAAAESSQLPPPPILPASAVSQSSSPPRFNCSLCAAEKSRTQKFSPILTRKYHILPHTLHLLPSFAMHNDYFQVVCVCVW